MGVFDASVKPKELLSQRMVEFIMRQYIGDCHFVKARSETFRVLGFLSVHIDNKVPLARASLPRDR